MVYRERNLSRGYNRLGSISLTGWGWVHQPYIDTFEGKKGLPSMTGWMSDHTSSPPYPDNPWVLKKSVRRSPIRLNGQHPSVVGFTYEYNNYCPGNYLSTSSYYLPEPSLVVTDGYLVTKMLANLNPNTAAVDVPLFLFEMKDFPRMLKNAGDLLRGARKPSEGINPSVANDAYLAWQFGWAPLFNDLAKLLNFSEIVDQRLDYLRKIGRDGGARISRRLGGGSVTHSSGPVTFLETYPPGSYLQASVTDSEDYQSWFSARVRMSPLSLPKNLGDQRALARRTAFGFSNPASTVWNALPWTFLIDYFTNVGNLLQSIGGLIPFTVTDACVMCTQTRRQSVGGGSSGGVTLSGGYAESIVKRRSVFTYPVPMIAPTPFLSGRQWTNIAALVTASAFRG